MKGPKSGLVRALSHPVRLQILAVIGNQNLTATHIAGLLPHVPKPSIYRHVSELIEFGMLRVTRTTPNRGTTERWVELNRESTIIRDAEKKLSNEEMFQMVEHCMEATRIIYRAAIQRYEDEVSPGYYMLETVYLTEDEVKPMLRGMLQDVEKIAKRPRPVGSKPFIVGTSLTPGVEADSAQNEAMKDLSTEH